MSANGKEEKMHQIITGLQTISLQACKSMSLLITVLSHISKAVPNKYFKEPIRAKAKRLGAQQVMFWELLQKFRRPKDFLGCPRLRGSC